MILLNNYSLCWKTLVNDWLLRITYYMFWPNLFFMGSDRKGNMLNMSPKEWLINIMEVHRIFNSMMNTYTQGDTEQCPPEFNLDIFAPLQPYNYKKYLRITCVGRRKTQKTKQILLSSERKEYPGSIIKILLALHWGYDLGGGGGVIIFFSSSKGLSFFW